MPNWTNDQASAITSRGSNLLVSAAAGSGKTAVLVERIIKLIIDDHIPLESMLIVTFTNAAASEMRERIVEALYASLETESDPFLRAQLNHIQKANIMTLHSFCIGLIRNNAHFIDLDPGFKVGETTELNIMMSEALDHTLEDFYEQADEDFIQFVERYSENRTDEKLQRLILSTYRFIQSQPEPLVWLKESVEAFSNHDIYKTLLIEQLTFDLSCAKEVLEEAEVICEQSDGPLEYLEAINNDLSFVEKLMTHLDDLEAFVSYIRTLSFARLKSIKKARKEEVDPMTIDEVKALRETSKGLLKEMNQFFEHKDFKTYLDDLEGTQEDMMVLYRLIEGLSSHYSILKLEKECVDFNDLEHFALKALKHVDVQKMYQNRFNYIFLDEYQDSNLVQETIINAIKRDDNVFLVGDVKQSIYKFRLADPTLFMEKYSSYEKSESAVNRRIDLKKNFRSRENILEGINFIFQHLMSKSFGEMVYDDDAKLYHGIDFKAIEDDAIEVHILDGTPVDDVYLNQLKTEEMEAYHIASMIKGMIGSKSYNRKKDTYFNVNYKDIVILMRAVSAWTPVFNEIFIKEGIPLFADVNGGYFDSLEIKMFVDLLRLIDNPLQDVPLLTVMRSPIFDFTTDDMIDIRLYHKEGHYFEALTFYDDDPTICKKILKMNDAIDTWRKMLLTETIDVIFWNILVSTGYYQYVGAMPGGKGRQGNLKLLLERASTSKDLFSFLRTVDKMKKSNTELGTAKVIGENDNVVRIMSIHKSKGLEFPVVIISGMGKKFNLRDAYQDVLLHKHVGIGPKVVDPDNRVYFDTLPKKIIKRLIKFESLSEEMRVLYVALTRAVDRLYLVGSTKLESSAKKWTRGPSMHNLINGQSYLDWIMMIISKHPSSKAIYDIAEKPYLGLREHKTKWSVKCHSRDGLQVNETVSQLKIKSVLEDLESYENQEVEKALEARFSYSYPYIVESQVQSKYSVSELKKLEKNQIKIDPLELEPQFLKVEKPKTKAEIGTLMHFIMQKIERHDDIEATIKVLVEKGMISEEDMKDIDVKGLKLFFESDLGRRYLKAEWIEKEKPFVLQKCMPFTGKDPILIQGIIDCYFKDEEGIVLLDYKTDYLYDEDVFVSRYHEQLDLYKEAIEKITGEPVVNTYIYSFFKHKSIEVNV